MSATAEPRAEGRLLTQRVPKLPDFDRRGWPVRAFRNDEVVLTKSVPHMVWFLEEFIADAEACAENSYRTPGQPFKAEDWLREDPALFRLVERAKTFLAAVKPRI